MKPLFLIGVAVCLAVSGCDSKNPLSDPLASKADERLVGLWYERNGDSDSYFLTGHAGNKFPASMMRVVILGKDDRGKVDPPGEVLAFPTVLGNKTYLNFIVPKDKEETLIRTLDEKGWKSVQVENYLLVRYKFEGEKLVLCGMDNEAKKKAISSGKIKGNVVYDKDGFFTDSTANLARFVAGAGESLWNTKEPRRFERLSFGKKP